jgi:Uma2 family endonuclease
LRDYERETRSGEAYLGSVAYVVRIPDLRTFSPDAAFFLGKPASEPGEFIEGAPVFAAEVRSEGDYGPAAERDMAAKRADYFLAGTQVVWDVDVLKDMVVRVYRANDPQNSQVYRRGEVAEAAPALPGWTMPVDDLFQ